MVTTTASTRTLEPGLIDMDRIVELLNSWRIPAYVEQTGGGTATIYAGGIVRTNHYDCQTAMTEVAGHPGVWFCPKCKVEVDQAEDRWERYAVLAGPGYFDGPNWTLGRGRAGDFYYGHDDDGENEAVTVDTDEAYLIAVKIREWLDEQYPGRYPTS